MYKYIYSITLPHITIDPTNLPLKGSTLDFQFFYWTVFSPLRSTWGDLLDFDFNKSRPGFSVDNGGDNGGDLRKISARITGCVCAIFVRQGSLNTLEPSLSWLKSLTMMYGANNYTSSLWFADEFTLKHLLHNSCHTSISTAPTNIPSMLHTKGAHEKKGRVMMSGQRIQHPTHNKHISTAKHAYREHIQRKLMVYDSSIKHKEILQSYLQ